MVRVTIVAGRKGIGLGLVGERCRECTGCVLGHGDAVVAGHSNFALSGNAIGGDGQLHGAGAGEGGRVGGDVDGGGGLDNCDITGCGFPLIGRCHRHYTQSGQLCTQARKFICSDRFTLAVVIDRSNCEIIRTQDSAIRDIRIFSGYFDAGKLECDPFGSIGFVHLYISRRCQLCVSIIPPVKRIAAADRLKQAGGAVHFCSVDIAAIRIEDRNFTTRPIRVAVFNCGHKVNLGAIRLVCKCILREYAGGVCRRNDKIQRIFLISCIRKCCRSNFRNTFRNYDIALKIVLAECSVADSCKSFRESQRSGNSCSTKGRGLNRFHTISKC